jgi:hypothetical protein
LNNSLRSLHSLSTRPTRSPRSRVALASIDARRHNSAAATSYIGTTAQPGTEPGVDVKRDDEEFRHLVAQCQIDVIEYGKDKASFEEFDNQGLADFLKLRGRQKSDWATVRWINVRGIDWEVIKSLTAVYGACRSSAWLGISLNPSCHGPGLVNREVCADLKPLKICISTRLL